MKRLIAFQGTYDKKIATALEHMSSKYDLLDQLEDFVKDMIKKYDINSYDELIQFNRHDAVMKQNIDRFFIAYKVMEYLSEQNIKCTKNDARTTFELVFGNHVEQMAKNLF